MIAIARRGSRGTIYNTEVSPRSCSLSIVAIAGQNLTMFLSYLTLALATLCLSLIAAAPINETGLHKRAPVQIVRNCVNSGQVALTFDGKPWPLPIYLVHVTHISSYCRADGIFQYEDDIARTLGNSKATFFVNGNSEPSSFSASFSSLPFPEASR